MCALSLHRDNQLILKKMNLTGMSENMEKYKKIRGTLDAAKRFETYL